MISSLGINEVGGGITVPRLILNRSTGGGVTWGKGKRTGNGAGGLGGQPVVQPNGTVIIPANNAFQRQIISFRSTDGGAMWSNTTVVANVQEHFVAGSLRTSLCPPRRSMPRARSTWSGRTAASAPTAGATTSS